MKNRGSRIKGAREYLESYPRIFEPVYSRTANDPSWFKSLRKLEKELGREQVEFLNSLLETVARQASESMWNMSVKNAWVSHMLPSAESAKHLREILYTSLENVSPYSFRACHGAGLNIFGALSKGAEKIIDDFYSGNPFEDFATYAFPYKRISSIFLVPIYRLDEEKIKFLLNYADQRSFTLAKFLDFVANFILCYNNEREKDVYELVNYPEYGFFVAREVEEK